MGEIKITIEYKADDGSVIEIPYSPCKVPTWEQEDLSDMRRFMAKLEETEKSVTLDDKEVFLSAMEAITRKSKEKRN